jgi:hypothetical protein
VRGYPDRDENQREPQHEKESAQNNRQQFSPLIIVTFVFEVG